MPNQPKARCTECKTPLWKDGTTETGYQRYRCPNEECSVRSTTQLYEIPDDDYHVEEDGNYLYISGEGQIATREELLNFHQVDLDVWQIKDFEARHYPTSMKLTDSKGNERPASIQNHYIKARFVRREMEPAKFPPLQPVYFNSESAQPRKKATKSFYKALIVPDSQNGYWRDMETGVLDPFHNRQCWDLAIQVAEEMQPDLVIYLGDMLDLPDWSQKFLRSPECRFTTQASLIELGYLFDRMRQAAPGHEAHYIEGNHEHRFQKNIIHNAVGAYGLKSVDDLEGHPVLSVPNLLDLDGFGIEYHGSYPKGEVWLNDNLRVWHGQKARSNSGATVKNIIRDVRNSEIIGHIHRVEMATKTVHPRFGAKSYMVMSPGTIAKIDGTPPGYNAKENWQQGLAEVTFQTGNGWFNINPIYIHEGRTVYKGDMWEGRDYTEELAANVSRSYFNRFN